MMFRRLAVLFTLLLSCLGGAAQAETDDPMQMTNVYSLITRQQGWLNTSRALQPEDLKGRIILLDFWTYCCINCMHVIPDLHYLEEKFGPDLTVIGVHSAKFKNEGDSENIRQAILRYDLRHPVVNDFDFSTWKAFGIHSWPTFVLINPNGMVEATYSGEGNRAQVEADIERLRSKFAGTINQTPLPLALEKDKQPATVLRFPAKLAYTEDMGGAPALFVSDSGHNRIVVMRPDGKIIQAAGSGVAWLKDGDLATAQFHSPQGMAYVNGLLYVADTQNHVIRAVDFAKGTVATVAGTGQQGHEREVNDRPALDVPMASPWDLAVFPDNKQIVIAMAGMHQLWSYGLDDRKLNVIAGMGNESIDDGHFPFNNLSQPSGLSPMGDKLYFVDAETSALRVYEKDVVKTLIGTGLFDFGYKEGVRGQALMQHPLGLFATDKAVFVADSYNHSIRRYDPASGKLFNFIGHNERGNKDGAFGEASFNEPNAVLLVGRTLYIADTNNNAIRMADLDSKQVSTLAVSDKSEAAAEVVEFSDALPNVEKMAALDVAEKNTVALDIGLQKGWHINDQAPSYLALFSMAGKPKSVASFDRDTVKSGKLMLPALEAGEYRLQGTIYYCEDKAGAQCLLKSFDMTFTAKAGRQKAVALKVN